MKKRIPYFILSHLIVVLGICYFPVAQAGEFEKGFRKQVAQFIDGLDADQQKACVLPLAHKNRWQMLYPGGKRPGIQIKSLNKEQRQSLEKTLRMVLSDHGWDMANKVASQDKEDGMGKYYLTCFGDPRGDSDFAFRIAEHHLTVVHLEVAKGQTSEFGPILLGSNPPDLWKADEKALMDVWKQIKHQKVLIKDKGAIASQPMPEGEGVLFSELSPSAQAALKSAWKQRISIFQPVIQERINRLHKARGGWTKSRVAFYKEGATKRCIDGGRWDFKCGLPGMVWDYEASRGHIHMSLWVK